MIFRAKSFVIFVILSQIFLAGIMLVPNPTLAQTQTTTLSINPSTLNISTSKFTVYVTGTQLQNVNSIHFVLSFNDGPLFLDVSNGVAAGDLFAGKQPTMTLGNYYLASSGRSYLNVLFELQGTQVAGNAGTKNVATVTFDVLSNALPGAKSGLNLESADAIFMDGSNYNYLDERSGLNLQSGSVTLGYLTTSVAANPIQTEAKKPVDISSTLKDALGNPLSGLSVDYYVGSQKAGSGVTNSNGLSSASYTPPDVGTFAMLAQYVGNLPGGKYASSSSTGTLTVVQPNTQPTSQPTTPPTAQPTTQPTDQPNVQPNNQNSNQQSTTTTTVNPLATTLVLNKPLETQAGQQVMLSGALKDANQKAIAGATIEFSAVSNGTEQQIGTSKTDQNGVALIPFTPAERGNYLIKAQFNQNAKYLGSSDSTMVAAGLTLTNLDINASTQGKVGDFISITATLTDANQQPINQADIQFQVQENGAWASLNSASTNSLGVASIEYKLDKAGTLTVRAVYAGNAEYGANITIAKNLDVAEENLFLNVLPYTIAIAASAIAVCVSSAFVIRKRQRRV